MSWYDPTYAYYPEEIADELGLDPLPIGDARPVVEPLAVYAGPFAPRSAASRPEVVVLRARTPSGAA